MSYKIRVPKKMKDVLTVSEMPFVKMMQEYAEKDDFTLVDYGKMIAELFEERSSSVKIFEPYAFISKNQRADDSFDEGTRDLDVWVECYIFGEKICGKFGAYMTDLWNISEDNKEEIKSHVYGDIFHK